MGAVGRVGGIKNSQVDAAARVVLEGETRESRVSIASRFCNIPTKGQFNEGPALRGRTVIGTGVGLARQDDGDAPGRGVTSSARACSSFKYFFEPCWDGDCGPAVLCSGLHVPLALSL
jgi:hypothetical protein